MPQLLDILNVMWDDDITVQLSLLVHRNLKLLSLVLEVELV